MTIDMYNAPIRAVSSQLGARLVVDYAIDTGPNPFQRDLDPVTVLEPQSRLSAHADTLRSFASQLASLIECTDRVVLTFR